MKEKKIKLEEYTVRIGPLLMKILEEQKKGIEKVTYGVVKGSHYEAGEIIAKKFLGEI